MLRLRRIIPAYAGSTRRSAPRRVFSRDHPRIRGEHCASSARGFTISGSSPHRDHPRIRGEHCASSARGFTISGSSPHTRGAQYAHQGHHRREGIIPAYAGSTALDVVVHAHLTDHPRIRGEHTRQDDEPTLDWGSSPHTRGARSWIPARPCSRGIIPAYAGSTARSPPA